jgi:hypothetical protein
VHPHGKKPILSFTENHIDVQYPFVRDKVEDKKVLLMKVETFMNVADSKIFMSTDKFS